MKHWEFLLQKEGDRSWLPLDSPDVEILEGRYRVVARSRQKNTEVDIRISHLTIEEDPPRRRIQKRSARTNQDGLIVVIPYTRLEPGLWELCCSSTDLMSDLVGDAWQYAVKLQVLAKESETEDWDSSWDGSAESVSNNQQEEDFANSDSDQLSESTPSEMDSETDAVPPSPAVAEVEVAIVPPSPVAEVEVAAEVECEQPVSEQPSEELTEPAPAEATQPVTLASYASNLPPEVAEILGASMDRLFQIAEQMSTQLVDDVMRDFDLNAGFEDAEQPVVLTNEVGSPNEETVDSDSQVEEQVASRHQFTSPNFSTSEFSQRCLLPAGTLPVLKLEQEALVAGRGEALTISGQIEFEPGEHFNASNPSGIEVSLSDANFETLDVWGSLEETLQSAEVCLQEVCLSLRDPQNLQILVSDRQPIAQTDPLTFSFSFSLPDDLETRLLIGEVLLCGTIGSRSTSTTLTTQTFTITAAPQELVGELEKINEVLDETLATHTEEDTATIDLPLELSQKLAKEQELPSLHLSFLEPDPVEEPQVEQPRRFQSLLGQPLPPQIYQPTPEQAHKTIELPEFIFPANRQLTTPEATDQPDESVEATQVESTHQENRSSVSSEQAAVAELTVPDNSVETLSEIIVESEQSSEDAALADDPETEQEIQGDRVDTESEQSGEIEERPELDLPSPVQMAFQSLNLQDRFLNRLTSLATDSELSDWLRSNLYPGQTAQKEQNGSKKKRDRLADEEVVVDDETPTNGRGKRLRRAKKSELSDPLEPNPLILPPDEPVPTPILEVASGELTAGKPVNIRVKLPHIEPRIYVKLWVIDRQSRSMLDGPRWLLDFIPNSKGELEVLTQLTVPFGSLEVLFEAIAIEMHTQRESHKVTVDRSVIPPDLPVMSLDDFDTRF